MAAISQALIHGEFGPQEDAEGALEDERWADVASACVRAREAYERSGSIDQLFVVDELEKRSVPSPDQWTVR